MKKPRTEPHTIVTGVTIAAVTGVSLWLLLGAVALPHGFSSRMGSLEARAEEADKLLKDASGPLRYGDGAVCRQAPDAAAASVRARLQAEIASKGLTATAVSATPAADQDGLRALAPIAFSLDVSGRYDQAVLFLGGLAGERPALFVDQADLKSQTSAVNLKLSGHFYCLNSAKL
jgi:hypothetical protein